MGPVLANSFVISGLLSFQCSKKNAALTFNERRTRLGHDKEHKAQIHVPLADGGHPRGTPLLAYGGTLQELGVGLQSSLRFPRRRQRLTLRGFFRAHLLVCRFEFAFVKRQVVLCGQG